MFVSGEELHLFEPGTLRIPPHVAEEIPDAGDVFLTWASQDLRPEQAREIESAVNGRRCQNGWFPLERLDTVGQRGFWRGPLGFLARMTAGDPEVLRGWATRGLAGNGAETERIRRVEATANHLLFTQGHAAAATWVMAVRPQAFLDLTALGDDLSGGWETCLATLRTKDVAKAVRRWNR
ncbi:hypothetical protein FB561_2616 [Kribbella amoyensis]|uniref:Uncharacterized protein n=1 Tax=Kribbella amoyensis TaxID=996641 RepID=A0A561BRH8_9ACTN|nr:hypothetical protein [Kribbella amoyensis]TWD81500.1 hypothetical protein FB561_2616 [Kribbella amoyensis]